MACLAGDAAALIGALEDNQSDKKQQQPPHERPQSLAVCPWGDRQAHNLGAAVQHNVRVAVVVEISQRRWPDGRVRELELSQRLSISRQQDAKLLPQSQQGVDRALCEEREGRQCGRDRSEDGCRAAGQSRVMGQGRKKGGRDPVSLCLGLPALRTRATKTRDGAVTDQKHRVLHPSSSPSPLQSCGRHSLQLLYRVRVTITGGSRLPGKRLHKLLKG
mmetsp:Transcript_34627/g.67839  ORF Transcript_34627/g.67839 Transcript_34627/m.67839 type:complete len:218 (-) Transcript_34627:1553-2206(-)